MSGALRDIDTIPREDEYTSLEAHQQETPGSFYDAKPVLHHHVQNAVLKVSEHDLNTNAALQALRTSAGPVEVTVPRIQIWVTSDFFILWSTSAGHGIQIPYRTISLHARQQNALYLQLCLSDISQTADDDLETVELLLTPEPQGDSNPIDAAEKLFTAVSNCADLHPDPDEDDDQEHEQEPEPGTGGWITSENIQDFMDENGEFRMPEGGILGAGAGTVRTADQFEDADAGEEVDGEDATDATKWRRTS
ncbi:uncharacterized protein M437DRAFT_52453 [Aureobasidium melanogenum CBS 110374]|uniref:Regulator of volume decrease after cellular swelling-domain-containing protein n=1 Tax=Aureobasidium melanogenum (strain CBS 110374) TaxID=1043003 RepID=A0A074VTW5_AURM1|nr:uncharacterized protein M437DRAFT_52453 [Aureobasidium melanogenum CBS 110374]KEQ61127.1 hypothetical protein M437DRAFT_52453 [Aureobasidium melanogenum CBS 110374]